MIAAAFAPVALLTVGEFRDWLLSDDTDTEALTASRPRPDAGDGRRGVEDHAHAGSDRGRGEMPGGDPFPQHDRARRPALDPAAAEPPDRRSAGIAASILDGLMFGCGDAVIGINPATDSLAGYIELTRDARRVCASGSTCPAQSCVLAHVTTAIARDRARRAGRSRLPVDRRHRGGERSFGVDLALLARGARGGAVARSAARSATTSCISRPGRAARCRPRRITASTSRRWRRAPTRSRARFEPLLVNTRGRLHRPGISL